MAKQSDAPPPFDPSNPETGQFYGYGATSIGTETGNFPIDPDTGLLLAQPAPASTPPPPPGS